MGIESPIELDEMLELLQYAVDESSATHRERREKVAAEIQWLMEESLAFHLKHPHKLRLEQRGYEAGRLEGDNPDLSRARFALRGKS